MRGVITDHTFTETWTATTNWTNTGAASMATMANPTDAAETIMSFVSASGAASYIDKVVAWDFSAGGHIDIDVYSGKAPWGASVSGQRFGFYLASDADYANNINPYGHTLFPGMNRLRIMRGRRIDSGDPGILTPSGTGNARMSSIIRLRTRTELIASEVLTTGLRKIQFGQIEKPAFSVRVDDAHSEGLAICNALIAAKIKFTLFVIGNKVGTANYMTEAEIDTLMASGYCEIGNHTMDHVQSVMPTDTLASNQAQIEPCSDYIVAQGWEGPRNSHLLFANPYGESGTNYEAAITASGIVQAFSVLGRSQGFEFAINPLYATCYIHDSFSASGVTGGGGASFDSTSMREYLKRARQSIGSGGLTVYGVHRQHASPTSAVQMSAAQLNEFVGEMVRLKSVADNVWLTEAVQYSRERLGLSDLY